MAKSAEIMEPTLMSMYGQLLSQCSEPNKYFSTMLNVDLSRPATCHLGVVAPRVEEAVDESEDLDGEGGAYHVEGDRGEAVLLEEGHEEADTSEDHDVDVLEHCEEVRGGGELSLVLPLTRVKVLDLPVTVPSTPLTLLRNSWVIPGQVRSRGQSAALLGEVPDEQEEQNDDDDLEN